CLVNSDRFCLLTGFCAIPKFIDATEIARSIYFLMNENSSEDLANPPLIDTLFLSEDFLLLITAQVCSQLVTTLSHQEIHVRLRAAQSLSMLARSEFASDEMKKHQDAIINALKTE
ncbi:hypothetical protein PRIPAC_96984, partial [Pristionchus pacificus]|uniref:Uncharacterized protein n=1 Tax=Pristionchus pacificus TaxID=54126 RepID=A0A2A6CTT3_PRIPA